MEQGGLYITRPLLITLIANFVVDSGFIFRIFGAGYRLIIVFTLLKFKSFYIVLAA